MCVWLSTRNIMGVGKGYGLKKSLEEWESGGSRNAVSIPSCRFEVP
jgi:hypothetical protein